MSCHHVSMKKMDENGTFITIIHFSRFRVRPLLVSWWRLDGCPGKLLKSLYSNPLWLQTLYDVMLEATFPTAAIFQLADSTVRVNKYLLSDLTSGEAHGRVRGHHAFTAGSSAEGLALEPEWGYERSDIDYMYRYGAQLGVCVAQEHLSTRQHHPVNIPPSSSSSSGRHRNSCLMYDPEGCYPAYARLRVIDRQTLLTHRCVENTSLSKINSPFDLMMDMFSKLFTYLKNGKLPHYFIPECNLLAAVGHDERQIAIKSINDILSDPIAAVLKCPPVPRQIFADLLPDELVATFHHASTRPCSGCSRDDLLLLLSRLDEWREQWYRWQLEEDKDEDEYYRVSGRRPELRGLVRDILTQTKHM